MIASRMADIEPFHVMEILNRAKQLEAMGKSVIHLEIGEPDFPTPQPIVEAGITSMSKGNIHYTPAAGIPALREAIAYYYQQHYRVEVDPERVFITAGASGALLLALGVLVSPGDEVLLADPGYPCNRHFIRLLEGTPVNIPVGPETDYQLSADLIKANWHERTIGSLIASPSNPTGTVIPPEEIKKIADTIKKRNGQLIVDEIYQGLTYDVDASTVLSITPDVFVINSFSKYFQMTGWRLGWLIAPKGYEREVEKLAQNIFIAPSTPAQYAALAAFQTSTLQILEERREQFHARRDFLLPALRELGFSIPVQPSGAFYLYADCTKFTDDSFIFAQTLLEKAYVAITPGKDFGYYLAEKHLRFAYTTDLNRLSEAVVRINQFVKTSS